MARFILLRLLHTVLILFGVSIVAFSLIHLIPGNPLDILLPPEAPKEVVERLKVEFGFDKPLYVQYLAWLGRVLSGNLGTSVFTGLRVTGELLNALGNTLVLAVPAALLGFSLYPTAPPRLLPQYSYVDTVIKFHTWGSLADPDIAGGKNEV